MDRAVTGIRNELDAVVSGIQEKAEAAASVLKEIGLGKEGASLLVPLFSFNLGVEIGQIAVAAVCLPVLWQLQKKPTFIRYGLPAISAMITLLGAYWLVERIYWP